MEYILCCHSQFQQCFHKDRVVVERNLCSHSYYCNKGLESSCSQSITCIDTFKIIKARLAAPCIHRKSLVRAELKIENIDGCLLVEVMCETPRTRRAMTSHGIFFETQLRAVILTFSRRRYDPVRVLPLSLFPNLGSFSSVSALVGWSSSKP